LPPVGDGRGRHGARRHRSRKPPHGSIPCALDSHRTKTRCSINCTCYLLRQPGCVSMSMQLPAYHAFALYVRFRPGSVHTESARATWPGYGPRPNALRTVSSARPALGPGTVMGQCLLQLSSSGVRRAWGRSRKAKAPRIVLRPRQESSGMQPSQFGSAGVYVRTLYLKSICHRHHGTFSGPAFDQVRSVESFLF